MIDGGKKFVFVFGLHRSGTSLVFKALKAHPEISGFDGTGVPEDEGQHLQTVVPTAKSLGGPGMFAFHPDAPMREDHPLATEVNARRLLAEWEHHWDLRRPVLIEKSPPTLIRTRFFQRLFPEAHFVCVTRHPAAVAYATQKWSQTTIQDLIDHWRRAHEIFAEDRPRLARAMTLKYEDFVAEPERVLGEIQRFIGVAPRAPEIEIRPDINARYFAMWEEHCGKDGARVRKMIEEREDSIRCFGYSLVDLAYLGPSVLDP
ncbi:MAG: sulfotransferase [Planctomycetes bacterium]|nr:sulfotransferase [Planctomycetota bacterium]